MTEPKDTRFADELLKATQAGKIQWGLTAKPGEFTASFRGKFSVLVAERLIDHPPSYGEPAFHYELRVLDEFGSILRKIEDPSIKTLLDAVRSVALHSDKAIEEIIEELRAR